MNKNDNLLGYVAELYYERGLSQREIGSIIGASRPTVSRLIDEAKKQGVVRIIIDTPVRKNAKLSNKLRKVFDLRDALVVCADYDFDESIGLCAKAAASFFSTCLQDNMNIGITWGRAVNAFIEAVEEQTGFSGINVAQMAGCMTMKDPTIDGFSNAQRLARKLHGTYTSINAPLFVEGSEVYQYLVNEPIISDSLTRASKINLCINGIGSLEDPQNSLTLSGYYDSYNVALYEEKGAVASFLGRFIGIDGRQIDVDDIYQICAPLSAVCNADISIVLNATAAKAEATLAVINGGYCDVLIVDEPLANALLELKK